MSRTVFGTFVLLLAVTFGFGQSSNVQTPQPDLSRLTGVWRGQMDGMPAVTLVVTDEGGELSGAVLFYFHTRKTVNDPWTSSPGLPEPMLLMHLDGTTLSFQVSHRRAHPPRTLNDPPVQYHLTVTGPNQASLVNEHEGLRLVMTRSDY